MTISWARVPGASPTKSNSPVVGGVPKRANSSVVAPSDGCENVIRTVSPAGVSSWKYSPSPDAIAPVNGEPSSSGMAVTSTVAVDVPVLFVSSVSRTWLNTSVLATT